MAKKKSIYLRLFNTVCSLSIIVAACYLFFAGMDLLARGILASSLAAMTAPVVFDGGSVVEVLVGIAEAFVEGLVLIFEEIGNIFNSIFG